MRNLYTFECDWAGRGNTWEVEVFMEGTFSDCIRKLKEQFGPTFRFLSVRQEATC